jgi:hypothetical protein
MAHLPILVCRILGEPYQDDRIVALGKDSKTPPWVILVFDMDGDRECLLVVNAIIAAAFVRAGSPLAGRYFRFTAGSIRDGKNYRDIDVMELEWDDDPESGDGYLETSHNESKEASNG